MLFVSTHHLFRYIAHLHPLRFPNIPIEQELKLIAREMKLSRVAEELNDRLRVGQLRSNVCYVIYRNDTSGVHCIQLPDRDSASGTSLNVFYPTGILAQNPVATEPRGLSGSSVSFHSTSSNDGQTLLISAHWPPQAWW